MNITVKSKGSDTCNNSKQLLQACGIKLIHNVIKNYGPSPSYIPHAGIYYQLVMLTRNIVTMEF